MPEVVRDGETGFVVAPGDGGALADRISFLLGDAAAVARMGAAARALVANKFALEGMMAEYRNVYDQATRDA
jgi:glycosyltransferase involved in cell wall biosynthesis